MLPLVINAAQMIRLRPRGVSSDLGPDVAEQDLIGELDKFRSEVTDELLRQQYLGGRAAVQLGLASRPSFDGQRDRDGQDGRAGERAEGEVLV